MKLTDTQRRVLQGIRDHGDPFHSARGMQQSGGYAGSLKSLHRNGLVVTTKDTDWRAELTDAGRGALAEWEASR